MATMNGKKGVDISYANGNIDLAKVKNAGYEFVMIRCGYGSDIASQDDSQFAANVAKKNVMRTKGTFQILATEVTVI